MRKHVVILGAGYGGVSAAKRLAKLAKKSPEIEITLIDKYPTHNLITELHEVAGNRILPEDLQISLNRLFESTKVNVLQDKINEIDFDSKTLSSDEHIYEYDYLILGAGSQPADYGVEGVKENAFTLWSIDDAKKINEHIKNCFQKAQCESDPQRRRELLSFVVAGGGFTGVEMVGELITWFDELSKQYGIPRKDVDLYLVEGLDRILPNLKDELVDKALEYLKKKNVEVKTGSFITAVNENSVVLQNDVEISTNTVIWTCGVKGAEIVEELELEKDKSERLIVNEYLQLTDYPEVFAIGDNSAAPWADEDTLPALVESAMQTGECAANNVYSEITGKEKENIEAALHGVMVSIGGDFAVADVTGLSLKGRPAMLLKHLVNMHYLFNIGGIKEGFSLIDEYIHDQASHKGLVSQLFSFFSATSRSLWLVPLRIFVGIMWLYEGYTKVRDGWLLSGDYLVSGASSSPIGDYAVGWYVWLNEAIIFKFPLFFQIVVTLSMIGIGISLIFGLFASLGALGSVGFSINFLLAGQYAHWSSEYPGHFSPLFWFLFASIALIGSGRSFGLDYYVLPWLKKIIWRRPKNKESHLKEVVSKK
ncbi:MULTISPECIES: FAD-dependent oxidoreductase [unclassified Halanaerobium]|uniref:FAD-dependent oxidoreductase n=1 Tax=unclassified Halanaerobium TaxID=2641197 RepID=UPI000DF37E12|nr:MULTISPECIES: FAD-dependent oxidoreductase [unclassified Halanaerobium]RCW41847.1 NADH dehydrogenase [Halanaerobium sp. MA284_MarDTE_T2]RCW87999.1 NADH dehydrogenase [Halanaerobium sp. DL-01]